MGNEAKKYGYADKLFKYAEDHSSIRTDGFANDIVCNNDADCESGHCHQWFHLSREKTCDAGDIGSKCTGGGNDCGKDLHCVNAKCSDGSKGSRCAYNEDCR